VARVPPAHPAEQGWGQWVRRPQNLKNPKDSCGVLRTRFRCYDRRLYSGSLLHLGVTALNNCTGVPRISIRGDPRRTGFVTEIWRKCIQCYIKQGFARSWCGYFPLKRDAASWKSRNGCPLQNASEKIKQFHYRPGQDLRVPEGWGSQISTQSVHEGGNFVSPTHRPPLSPTKYS